MASEAVASEMTNTLPFFSQNFRGETIPEEDIERVRPIVENPEFQPEMMLSKSAAAANLCTWVVNIYRFNRIYVKVKPLMDTLEGARASKAAADASLGAAQAAVAGVERKLAELQNKFIEATEEKAKVSE